MFVNSEKLASEKRLLFKYVFANAVLIHKFCKNLDLTHEVHYTVFKCSVL